MDVENKKQPPAILYVLHSGNLYGTERMALATLSAMGDYGRRVVFSPRPTETDAVAVAARRAGFEHVPYETRRQFFRAVLPWFIRHRQLDLIATGVGESFICHALSKLLFVRLRQLQVVHGGTEDAHAYGRKKPLNRLPVRMVAVSEFVRGKLIDSGLRARAISVISNFLDEAESDTHLKRAAYAQPDGMAAPMDPACVRVAVVSRVDPIKRIDLLVQAIEQHGLSNFRFDVYGSGKDLATLRARAAALPNIRFHGFVQDVLRRTASADLLLHLCPAEPFGLVILEAFRSGVVTIVPDLGGSGEIVEDGVTGLRFKAGDTADLVRVLELARGLPAARLQALADAARATLAGRFSQHVGAQRYREALAMPV